MGANDLFILLRVREPTVFGCADIADLLLALVS